MQSPCLGCTERTALPNCHMGCDRYKRFCVERERIRQKRDEERKLSGVHSTRVRAMKRDNK